jgi:hypothetical protein
MARARSLAEFQKSFSDEESCAAFLFKRRWPDGFVCPGCGKRRAVGLKSRPRLHECLDCGRQTSSPGLAPRIWVTVNGFTLDFCEGAYGDVVRKGISATPRGDQP